MCSDYALELHLFWGSKPVQEIFGKDIPLNPYHVVLGLDFHFECRHRPILRIALYAACLTIIEQHGWIKKDPPDAKEKVNSSHVAIGEMIISTKRIS